MILERLRAVRAIATPGPLLEDRIITWKTTTQRGYSFTTIMEHYERAGFMVLSWNNDLENGNTIIHIRPYPTK